MEAQNIVRREVEPLCHSNSSKYRALAECRDVQDKMGTLKRRFKRARQKYFQEYFPVSVMLAVFVRFNWKGWVAFPPIP
jgi:hypothetical protein